MFTQLKTYSFLLLAAVAMVFYTCKDDGDNVTAHFSASRNNQDWEADASDVKAVFKNGQITLTSGLCGISMVFNGQTTGEYLAGRDQPNFAIAVDENCGEPFYTNLENLATGVFEITEINRDRKTISGTFGFIARNKSGAPVSFQGGRFNNIPFTEEAGNSANKPTAAWIEEDGTKYALNEASFSNSQLYASNNAETKILAIFFLPSVPVSGTYDVTPLALPDGNIHLVYTLIHNSTEISTYGPAPGSQLTYTLVPGFGTSFTGNLDIDLVKTAGTGPDNLHLKSEFEVYQ